MKQFDTENADRNLTSIVKVLTHTPHATLPKMCIGYVAFGDGVKNLDGSGGNFELTVTVGGQTVQPNVQTIAFDTAVRTAVWTTPFPVPANKEVILRAKSPNAGDSDVDVTAYLYDLSSVIGTDGLGLISTDAQDLSATLDVNAKLLGGAAPNNLAAGAQMDLVNAPNATAVTAIKAGLSTHDAAAVKTAIEAAGSHLALILADTGTDGVVVASASKTGYSISGTKTTLDALNDITAASVVTAILAKTGWTAGGATTIQTVLKWVLSMAHGKFTLSGNTYTFYDDDDTTVLGTLTISASGRTVT